MCVPIPPVVGSSDCRSSSCGMPSTTQVWGGEGEGSWLLAGLVNSAGRQKEKCPQLEVGVKVRQMVGVCRNGRVIFPSVLPSSKGMTEMGYRVPNSPTGKYRCKYCQQSNKPSFIRIYHSFSIGQNGLRLFYHALALQIKLLWCLVGCHFLCCACRPPSISASAALWAALPAAHESREREQVCRRVMLWLVLLFRSKGLHL